MSGRTEEKSNNRKLGYDTGSVQYFSITKG